MRASRYAAAVQAVATFTRGLATVVLEPSRSSFTPARGCAILTSLGSLDPESVGAGMAVRRSRT